MVPTTSTAVSIVLTSYIDRDSTRIGKPRNSAAWPVGAIRSPVHLHFSPHRMIRTIAITLFSNADDEPGRRFGSQADDARRSATRCAANIAKLPELLNPKPSY